MPGLVTAAIERIARSTRIVEAQEAGGGGNRRSQMQSVPYPIWCEVKDRINYETSGQVYAMKTSSTEPVKDTTKEYKVANPFMGDLLPGVIVPVQPWLVRGVTSRIPFAVSPFQLRYEGVVTSGIAAGGVGSVTVYKNGALWQISGVNQTIQAHWRWIDKGASLSANRKVACEWDFVAQRFFVESVECP